METRQQQNGVQVDWSKFGLGAETNTRGRRQSGGFVGLGNEYDYAAGGHQASGADELFAEEQVTYTCNISFYSSDTSNITLL